MKAVSFVICRSDLHPDNVHITKSTINDSIHNSVYHEDDTLLLQYAANIQIMNSEKQQLY